MVQELKMTCQTCKHWFRDQKQVRLPNRSLCLLTTSAADDKPDGTITIGNEQSAAVATANVIAPFGGGLVTAGLETVAGFGCSQYEAK